LCVCRHHRRRHDRLLHSLFRVNSEGSEALKTVWGAYFGFAGDLVDVTKKVKTEEVETLKSVGRATFQRVVLVA
jgi:hypothetical protein